MAFSLGGISMRKALLALLLCMPMAPAVAAQPVLIGTFDSWKAYHFVENGEKVCFMTSKPHKKEGNYKKRGDVAFFVTQWSSQQDKNVVSVSNGYRFKDGTPVTLDIGEKKFTLLSQGDTAWAQDHTTDDFVVDALRAGEVMVVKGVSQKGTETTDTYALKGDVEAYKAITAECTGNRAGDK